MAAWKNMGLCESLKSLNETLKKFIISQHYGAYLHRFVLAIRHAELLHHWKSTVSLHKVYLTVFAIIFLFVVSSTEAGTQ